MFERYLRDSYWHLICHRNELQKARDFVRFNWLDDEVVVFRDGEDYVAFDNKCPHRGTRMFIQDSGNQAAVCPYHGWFYSNGKVKVADASSFTQCSLEGVSLNKLKLEWCGDFLFVSVLPHEPLRNQLGDLWVQIESISHSIADRRDFSSYDYECNWKISLENALEPYHVPLIHPASLGTLKLSAGENKFSGSNSVWYSEVKNERMAKQLAGLRRLFELEYQFAGYMSIYIFPFTMLSSTFGYSYSLQNFFPSGQIERTHFSSRLFASKLATTVESGALDSFFESTAKINRQVFEEDHQICKRVSADNWSPHPPKYFSDREEKLLHFRKSCLEVMRNLGIAGGA